MVAKGFTAKVLSGMVIGAVVGVLLMYLAPVGIQPGDKISVTYENEEPQELKVAPDDKSEKLLDVLLENGEEGKAVLESPQTKGHIRLDDGSELEVAGLQMEQAAAAIESQTGKSVSKVSLAGRSKVSVMPPITQVFYVIGELFIRLLKMLIVPLIVATVLVGIASLGNVSKMGALGKQTLGFYFGTMLVATTIGILTVNIVKPGAALNWTAPAGTIDDPPTIIELLLRIIPTNPMQALAQFDVLQILFFTIIFAIAMLKVGKSKVAPVFNFFEGLNDIVYVLIGWVMALAPIGVGALIAHIIGIQSPEFLGTLLESLGLFAVCVLVALTIHFGVLTALVKVIGKYSPITFLKKASPMMATAFGTDSSSATMPVTMSVVRDMGVSKRIAGFVVPVGATANMDGTALYEAVAVLFFAQAYNIDLTVGQQIIVAFTAMLAAVGAAGIPSAGLVTMALVLTAVGLPVGGIALLFAIDRPLDMCRTVVNVYGDATTSRVVQTWNPDIRAEDDDIATEYAKVEPSASYGDFPE